MSRTVAWFSCGAASAVASKLSKPDVVAYCETGSSSAQLPKAMFGRLPSRGEEYVVTGAILMVLGGFAYLAMRRIIK